MGKRGPQPIDEESTKLSARTLAFYLIWKEAERLSADHQTPAKKALIKELESLARDLLKQAST